MIPLPNNEEMGVREPDNLNIHVGSCLQITVSKSEKGIWLFRGQYCFIMQQSDDSKPLFFPKALYDVDVGKKRKKKKKHLQKA